MCIRDRANITLKGNEIHTIGNLPEVGSSLKDLALVNDKLEVKTLEDYNGKRKIFNIFPSIDTGICAASARKFNVEAGNLENTVVINVSKDLPFALGRFCAAAVSYTHLDVYKRQIFACDIIVVYLFNF